MARMSEPTIVWDCAAAPDPQWQHVLLWRRYREPPGGKSVPRYLEEHAEGLRTRYLAFIHDLGQQRFGGGTLAQHFDRGDGFSFWWMTHLAEKSPFKSPRLYDCLRLLALQEMLGQMKPASLVLHSDDPQLAKAIRALCSTLGIGFSLVLLPRTDDRTVLRRLYEALPWSWQGLLSLRHTLRRWPLRALAAPRWFSGRDSLLFCSYFFNLDPAAAEQGHFHSRQWENLPARLHQDGKRSNWIHHMLLTPAISEVATGRRWAIRFNLHAESEGRHSFVESRLSPGVLVRAIWDWLWLGRRARLVEPQLSSMQSQPASFLWPLLRDDWNVSLRGPIALANCLWMHLFDRALAAIPHQPMGLYLWENQGWEVALLHAWRRHGHGTIIGVPHATTAFWHVNNFDDVRVFTAPGPSPKSLPDCLAVNGPMAWRMFTMTGYPPERLRPVEALRFQYLAQFARFPRAATERTVPADVLKVLVLGDFTRRQTLAMLSCLVDAEKLVPRKLSFTLKVHPVSRIEASDVPDLSVQFTDRPLGEILGDFDLAFSSNSSSAGLDALLSGVPLAVFLDDNSLNHSPLRGVPGIRFVNSPEELAKVLESNAEREQVALDRFFWLDKDLPRWRALVSPLESGKT